MDEAPKTVWEHTAQVLSGIRLAVRGAEFSIGDARRGAVTVALAVPDGSFQPRPDGGITASALLNPEEARAVARWLEAAATAADAAGPPLYI